MLIEPSSTCLRQASATKISLHREKYSTDCLTSKVDVTLEIIFFAGNFAFKLLISKILL